MHKADNLTTILCWCHEIYPLGHSRPVTGLLYLLLYTVVAWQCSTFLLGMFKISIFSFLNVLFQAFPQFLQRNDELEPANVSQLISVQFSVYSHTAIFIFAPCINNIKALFIVPTWRTHAHACASCWNNKKCFESYCYFTWNGVWFKNKCFRIVQESVSQIKNQTLLKPNKKSSNKFI